MLAGGAATRLGGAHKPALEVGGSPIVARVLTAVSEAGFSAVVVGRGEGVPPGIPVVREEPPGGGPVEAVREGLRHLSAATPDRAGGVEVVLLLAADLPFLTADSLSVLVDAVGGGEDAAPELAVYVDAGGQAQWLCSAWRTTALVRRLGDDDAPRGIRGLAQGLTRLELTDVGGDTSDVDTPEDLAAARVRSGNGRGPDAAAVRVGDQAERGAGG